MKLSYHLVVASLLLFCWGTSYGEQNEVLIEAGRGKKDPPEGERNSLVDVINIERGAGSPISSSPVSMGTVYDNSISAFLESTGSLAIETTKDDDSIIYLYDGVEVSWTSQNTLFLDTYSIETDSSPFQDGDISFEGGGQITFSSIEEILLTGSTISFVSNGLVMLAGSNLVLGGDVSVSLPSGSDMTLTAGFELRWSAGGVVNADGGALLISCGTNMDLDMDTVSIRDGSVELISGLMGNIAGNFSLSNSDIDISSTSGDVFFDGSIESSSDDSAIVLRAGNGAVNVDGIVSAAGNIVITAATDVSVVGMVRVSGSSNITIKTSGGIIEQSGANLAGECGYLILQDANGTTVTPFSPDPDGDGVFSAPCFPVDQCPDDPEKSEEGECGCGVPDEDTDSDGAPNCVDECPNNPDKQESVFLFGCK